MAVAVIAHIPGGTAEQDEAMAKQVNPADTPAAGSLLRLAGPVEGGWMVIGVWDSLEAFVTFRRERLEPAFRRAGRPMPQFQISPLHSVRIAYPFSWGEWAMARAGGWPAWPRGAPA